jgi:hypothetical protein
MDTFTDTSFMAHNHIFRVIRSILDKGQNCRERLYSGCQKNVPVFKRFFYNRAFAYAALPYLGVFNRALGTRIHGYTVLLAPIKALPCLCIFPPMARKPKPPALRVVGDSEHYYGKRYKSE